METFELDSNKKVSLKKLKTKEIVITKVSLENSSEVANLFLPIAIETVYPTGRIVRDIFNPISYFSNTQKALSTDEPFNLIIKNCDLVTLNVINPQEKKFKFIIHYSKPKYELKVLNIAITQDLEGYIYSLPKVEMEKIKEYFPNSNPVGQIFMTRSNKLDFETLYGDVLPHILPTLTGLTQEELLRIGKINIEKY